MELIDVANGLMQINQQISEVSQVYFFEIVYESRIADQDSTTIYIEVRHYVEIPVQQRPYRSKVVGEKTYKNGSPWYLTGDGTTLGESIYNIANKFQLNLMDEDVISNPNR
jgi:hypothetical protein